LVCSPSHFRASKTKCNPAFEYESELSPGIAFCDEILTFQDITITAMSEPQFFAPDPGLCTEEEISYLVHTFYATARKDPLLGPIFEAHVTDWNAHFVQMINFWSMKLRGTSRFRGAPMPKHVALPGLTSELFERWLQLFHQTTSGMENANLQFNADMLARHIGSRLWLRYQMERYPNRQLVELCGA
jgi:hemoglobin